MVAPANTRRPRSSASVRAAVTALAALLALGVLTGCAESGGDGIRVVATTSVARSITEQVAGPGVEVTQLVPDDAAPHSYAPSAVEQRELATAHLLVHFSDSFEAALPLETAERRFAIADHAGELRRLGTADEHGGGIDPHVWMDPTRIATALPALADELAGIDPSGAAAYRRRAEDLAAELSDLDRELGRLAEEVPEGSRVLVSSHESLGYFADRYDYEYIGTVFGPSPEAQVSTRDAVELLRTILERDVGAVFAQRGESTDILERFERWRAYEVVDDLSVEQLGPGVGSYQQMLRGTARRIAEALG